MWTAAALAAEPTSHSIRATIEPETHQIHVVDAITFPGEPDRAGHVVYLHDGLTPTTATMGWRIEAGPTRDEPLATWVLRPTRRATFPVTLEYAGAVHHPPVQVESEHQRSFATTPGDVSAEGVVLSGASGWVPDTGGLIVFDLAVDGLPAGWTAVSSGARTDQRPGGATFVSDHPGEEVHLVAGPLTETTATYERADGTVVDLRVALRTPDAALAERFVTATREDLALYESFLPRFPWPSFTVVENSWETGFGMPGFTLLGPQVLRFPFLLGSSYPHELLHNWWGNSVYVEPATGNWCEGLTAYVADHLFAERRGEGVDHRRATLQRYADFAGEGDDLPLAGFRGRVSGRTEAVGYGKAAMVFHMARQRAGDEAFRQALGHFTRDHAYERATWDDLAAAFTSATTVDWRPWFGVWVERPGAPRLELGSVEVVAGGEGYVTTITVKQTQDVSGFPLDVPLALTFADEPAATVVRGTFAQGEKEITVVHTSSARVVRVDLDPELDVMRALLPGEAPAAFSGLFGEGPETFVIASGASDAERQAFRAMAEAWAKPDAPVIVDDAGPLPAGNVWVLGFANRHAAAALGAGSAAPTRDGATVGGSDVARAGHSVVTAGGDGARVLGFVGVDGVDAVAGLTRKLPHYGRYSWLVFSGAEPTIASKGTSASKGSPTVRLLEGEVPRGALPLRAALVP